MKVRDDKLFQVSEACGDLIKMIAFSGHKGMSHPYGAGLTSEAILESVQRLRLALDEFEPHLAQHIDAVKAKHLASAPRPGEERSDTTLPLAEAEA